MTGSLIVAGARTPIGKLGGSLASFSATGLGSIAIRAALERSNVAPERADYVFMGQVVLAGAGQMTARQAAAGAGIPLSAPATTVNKVCLSGLNAIHLADLYIRNGDADIVVAGGMESMTNTPYLLPGARAGYRLGDGSVVDSLMHDGLTCAIDHCSMGASVERDVAALGISRAAQDEFSWLSHDRAARAQKDGLFRDEIVPVAVHSRSGDRVVADDEGIRAGTTVESLAGLRSSFANGGTITAGNASQISDGASAVVVCSDAAAERLGLLPLGRIIGYGQVAGPDTGLLHQPAAAAEVALARSGMAVGDLDLIELNEAFAAVAVASIARLGITSEITNVNGGAIALGHPIGMSGNRIALHLLHELHRRGGGRGAATLCGGGGQGEAVLLETV